MNDKHSKINKLVRTQRLLNISKFLLIFLIGITLSIYLIKSIISTGETKNTTPLTGIVETMHQDQSNFGSGKNYFFVRMESGDLIRVAINKATPFNKNAKVLIERVEKENGRINYYFLRYVK